MCMWYKGCEEDVSAFWEGKSVTIIEHDKGCMIATREV